MGGLTDSPTPPTAIISYSYDSEQHKERVLQLARELRARGIDCLLDRFVDPTDWPLWMESRIRKSDWVLVVATEAYLAFSRNEAEPGRGLGASWEYACIRAEIHAARGETRKFLPIVFHARDSAFVPDALRRRTLYNVKSSSDLNRLINKMRGIPDTAKAAPLGPVTNLRIVSNGIEPRPELGASTGFRAINARKRLFVLHQRHDDEMSDAAFFSRWEDQKAARRWDDPAIASLRARYGESFDGKTDSAFAAQIAAITTGRPYRTLYATDSRTLAFIEALQDLRPPGAEKIRSNAVLEKIRKVAQNDATIDVEPDPTPGVVPRDHFDRWHIGSFMVDKDLAFADLEHIESLAFIRAKLGQFARDIGLREITIATIMGCNLTFTQRVSQLAYWARANFSGVFQPSVYGRISASDEREGNWAIFERFGENRIRFINPRSTRVVLTDRDLNDALKFLRLRLADETRIERWIRTSQGFLSRLRSR